MLVLVSGYQVTIGVSERHACCTEMLSLLPPSKSEDTTNTQVTPNDLSCTPEHTHTQSNRLPSEQMTEDEGTAQFTITPYGKLAIKPK